MGSMVWVDDFFRFVNFNEGKISFFITVGREGGGGKWAVLEA